ncbi:DivIVA domain-containing protein [Haloactinopolyspora alba]|uniref:DivIVA domain-containing protein n=2 Tax=Haloactinopolyspora alba TaxID=648780 RepID=A0A2P8DXA8_9ACTN|nr:DivIVA domain-containing protein [Haloactinopolyspora alba]
MFVVFVVVAAVVLFTVVVVAAGRGDVLDADDARVLPLRLPERALARSDVDQLRFPVTARGYRMDEVDRVLDRLGRELDERDARIADLEARAAQVTPLPRRRPGEARGGPS